MDIGSSPKKIEHCKICHDEDEESNMEAPCFCRGSLKYAHRKCVQRWCNEKGDTICEICQQPFKPGYTTPPPLFHYGGIPMNFSVAHLDLVVNYMPKTPYITISQGNWEVSRRDLINTQFVSLGSHDDRNFLYPNFDDYSEHTSRNLIFCRVVAMTFIILLVLRHTLPFIVYGVGEHSVSLAMLVALRTMGVLLPIYVMFKAVTAVQQRRVRQDFHTSPLGTSNEENELSEAHVIPGSMTDPGSIEQMKN